MLVHTVEPEEGEDEARKGSAKPGVSTVRLIETAAQKDAVPTCTSTAIDQGSTQREYTNS